MTPHLRPSGRAARTRIPLPQGRGESRVLHQRREISAWSPLSPCGRGLKEVTFASAQAQVRGNPAMTDSYICCRLLPMNPEVRAMAARR